MRLLKTININRLWIRFTFTFILISLFGSMLLLTIGFLTTQTGVLRMLIRNELTASGSLTDALIAYYREHGEWTGVEAIIQPYEASLPHGPEGGGFELVFMNEGQQVIYGQPPTSAATDDTSNVIAITIDGRTRGYLSILQVAGSTDLLLPTSNRPSILTQISRLLLSLGCVSAIFGLMAGVIAGLTLTKPLAQLAQTARRLGKHDFTARAEVRGSSEMREVAHAFNEMAHDLEQAETLRRNLVADVAHELRTPLSVLQANLQALADGVYPLTTDEIDRLLTQTELLTRLVNELRELSQAEARQLPLTLIEVDLNDLLTHVWETFQQSAARQGVRLELDHPAEPLTLVADSGRLQQVLTNLVQNAITHTPPNGVVKLCLKRESDQIIICVQDTGEGIMAEHLPYVFERFYRIDRSRSRETGGTGLGLAIAKAIVELHQGRLQVASEGIPGRGTTFTLSFNRSNE